MIIHNHITRTVNLSNGICPACDFQKFKNILVESKKPNETIHHDEELEKSFLRAVWPMLKDSREEFERMENAWREKIDYGRPPGQ